MLVLEELKCYSIIVLIKINQIVKTIHLFGAMQWKILPNYYKQQDLIVVYVFGDFLTVSVYKH